MPRSEAGGVVDCVVKVNGKAVAGNYPVTAVHIEQAINRIASATICYLDGNASNESFTISASDQFIPGNKVTIEAGYDGRATVLFEGIVTKQSIRVDNTRGPLLEITCKDKAVKMTVGRKNANFAGSTDSDVMRTIIANAGLDAQVAATSITMPTLVQYYVTDWDFVLSRADVNGMVVSTLNNQVKVFDPTAGSAPVLTLTYGRNLYSIDAELNSTGQFSEVTATAWSYQSQQLLSAVASNDLPGPGDLSSKSLAGVVDLPSFQLQTTATETDAELMGWAQAQMRKSALSKITGKVDCQGSAKLLPGSYLSLEGLGARFDGDHFVSSVRHAIEDGNWMTEAAIGLSADWFTQQYEIAAPPAAGLLPGIEGLFNATVLKIEDDPEGEFRIQVEVALLGDKGTGLRARLANFYSTNGQGVFFLPEVGDEVILGFLNQDPRFPVILGSMYSQKNVPYELCAPNQLNSMKAIVSKSTLRVMFDDENQILSLVTPAKQTVVLDDKNQQIEIRDSNKNSIVMSASGIAIKSEKTISIEAGQQVTVSGTEGIAMSSSAGNCTASAVNIAHTAETQFSAKADGSAEIQGGLQLTLKAAMVMIN
jgi:Rhs element Vgr protein